MTYKTSACLQATRIIDDQDIDIQLKDLQFFDYGAFSNVYRGNLLVPSTSEYSSCQQVVIKKTWSTAYDAPTSTAEIQILKLLGRLNHKNIVRLLYTFHHDFSDCTCYSLVFECLDLNLYQYLKQHNRKISLVETKMFTWQLFRGLYHLQRANICHRDIKPQNLLVNYESGLLKIGDFGNSTIEPEKTAQPPYHVTRYYRPPELLLESKYYGIEIDIWSAGCVFGEMLRGCVLFMGSDATDQMDTIMSLIGMPNNEELKNLKFLDRRRIKHARMRFQSGKVRPTTWSKMVPLSSTCSEEAQSVLQRILVYDPYKRLHGVDLLTHQFFKEIFLPNTVRPNGKRVGCLSLKDLEEVRLGDKSMTASMSN